MGYSDRLCQAKQDRRNRMAYLFDQISLCLTDVVVSIEKQEIPHGKCSELATYSYEIPNLINCELGEEQSKEIGELLRRASRVEILAQQSLNIDLTILKEAAGKFTALANILRI